MKHALKLAMMAALVALPACGSKDKAEVEEPKTETLKVEKEPEPEPAAEPENEPEPEPAAAPSASLEETIYFEFDSNALDDRARSALEENFKWLQEDEGRTLTIEGHTDDKGTDEYNLGLGENRARTARDYLIRLGIDASRIRVITYGEERPASRDDAENRRSVFVATRK